MELGTGEPEAFQWFVGVDWGTVEHTVNVADAAGQHEREEVVAHTSDGLLRFVDRLTNRAGGRLASVAVAIEVPRGAVVEVLLERGAAVFAVNPKQLDRFRDRFSPAGAKDDRLDAKVLRSALQTDRQYFRRLAVDEPLVIRIRELTRASDEGKDLLLVSERLPDGTVSAGPLTTRTFPETADCSSAFPESVMKF